MKKVLIPDQDNEYDTFMTNLFKQVTLKATEWKIAPTEFDGSVPLLASWGTSYGLTKNPVTVTTVNVTKKNKDRKALTKYARPFISKNIYLNDNMEDDDLKLCGVEPHLITRTSKGKPSTIPLVEFKAGNGHTILAHYRQQMTEPGSSGRGKPDGVGSIQHTTFIGAEPPADPNKFGRLVVGMKSPTEIPFDAEDAGKLASIASRWVSTNNINGDWTIPVSRLIP